MQEITCPACGSSERYTLRDGRLQCTECRKKYSVATHRTKLSEHALRLVAESFWRMTPASAAAAQQGMNCKTLQKYYDLLRRAIAETDQGFATEQLGSNRADPALFRDAAARNGLGKDARPLFCLAQKTGKEFLLFAAEDPEGKFADISATEILGWVYAQNAGTLLSLDLDQIHFLPDAESKGSVGVKSFWIHAKRSLVKYHGGFRRNFPLFVHEMHFRSNSVDEAAALSRLMKILMDA